MTTADRNLELSVATLVNDDELYEGMRASLSEQFDDDAVQWLPVRADEHGWNAATGLNSALEQARAPWVLCVHQDVLFPDGWWPAVQAQLARCGRQPALAGLMGATRHGQLRGHVHDPRGSLRWGPLPCPVLTLDEHVLLINRRYGLRFSEQCPGFHCYGADLALQARTRRLPVVALDASVIHQSTGRLDASFRTSAEWLQRRWAPQLGGSIPTCAANINDQRLRTVPRRMATALRRRISVSTAAHTPPPRRPATVEPELTPILIVSYYFPPMGGAGTQRFASFVQHLPAMGYRPIVIAAGASSCTSAPTADPDLTTGLPPEAIVYRVDADPASALPMRDRLARLMRLHVDEERWARAAEPLALTAAFRHRAAAVITTVSPYASARIGAAVQEHIGIPWVLDLRDPWALDPWRGYTSGFAHQRDVSRMRNALRGRTA